MDRLNSFGHPRTRSTILNSDQDSVSQPVLFSKLPVEIRLEIWRLSLPALRVVRIYTAKPFRFVSHAQRLPTTTRAIVGSGPVPLLLHICSESRIFGQKYYSLAFGDQTHSHPVYFDFARDVLCFVDSAAVAAFYGKLKSGGGMRSRVRSLVEDEVDIEAKIQFLVVNSRLWTNLTYHLEKILSDHTNLKCLCLPKKFNNTNGLSTLLAMRERSATESGKTSLNLVLNSSRMTYLRYCFLKIGRRLQRGGDTFQRAI